MNTIRRAALCLTLIPCMIAFLAFSFVVLGPMFVFIAWVTGSRRPFRDVWQMMFVGGPWEMVRDAWAGK